MCIDSLPNKISIVKLATTGQEIKGSVCLLTIIPNVRDQSLHLQSPVSCHQSFLNLGFSFEMAATADFIKSSLCNIAEFQAAMYLRLSGTE